MKKIALVLAGTALLSACNMEKAEVESDDQKGSYALGFRTGEQMSSVETLDIDAMLAGIRDGYNGAESQLPSEELDSQIQAFQTRFMEAQQAEATAAAAEKLAESEAFLAANAEKEGVTVTESGLQYEVLAEGAADAASPTLESAVEVHYHGTLPDGTIFDSSVERDQPATFELTYIIKAWQEALPMMKVGDKWRLTVPPELGYGEQGSGGAIGPNEVLIFEVELLSIVQPDAQ